jgi:hypothetical protein
MLSTTHDTHKRYLCFCTSNICAGRYWSCSAFRTPRPKVQHDGGMPMIIKRAAEVAVGDRLDDGP